MTYMILRIFLSAIGISIGLFFVIKTELVIRAVGYNAWAEDKLGSGGTWTFYKLIGILICFISLLYLTGLLGSTVRSILSLVFPQLR